MTSTISIWYFHGQRNPGDDPNNDGDNGNFFDLEYSTDNGESWSSMTSHGDGRVMAVWTGATADIAAMSSVMLRVRESDGPDRGDLIEAGVDNMKICPNNSSSTIDTVDYCGMYDPEEDSWSEMNPIPYGRNYAAMATDGTSMYIFGGRNGKNRITDGFDEVQIFDMETGIWKTSINSNIPSLPQKQGGTGKAVYYQGKFYIMGGETQLGYAAWTRPKI